MDKAKAPHRAVRAVVLAIVCVLAGFPARADDHETSDHEQARQAVTDGRALPLAKILEMVSPALRGELVGVELEVEGSNLIYELKVLAPDGRLAEFRVDAATGAIIEGGGRTHDAGADR